MRRINKIVALISLLSNRQHVTMDTIKSVCGISERSAYRYLNFISEADFPVHFDKDLGAYKLSKQNSRIHSRLTVAEILLIVVGLKILTQKLNDHYRDDIRELLRCIIAENAVPLESVLQSFSIQLDDADQLRDCSQLVSSILVNAAIIDKRKIRILVNVPQSGQKALDLNNPSLTFNKVWKLVNARDVGDVGDAGDEEASLADIQKVSIL
ncbi:MAG: hypothetical protein OEV49_00210 [candidate division Zixibacteria bacterium]|nr:hypothetical protein [candidate division Zixibacteria bacterium]MDH3936512.1 hypothetical protein [candidate division Zixibacteria bacterium]MDH4033463.1 hypothetical protein [candidate division Zixibacteria bacterium]